MQLVRHVQCRREVAHAALGNVDERDSERMCHIALRLEELIHRVALTVDKSDSMGRVAGTAAFRS